MAQRTGRRPPASREEWRQSFLSQATPAARRLREFGVLFEGTSRVAPPYETVHKSPDYHSCVFTLAGNGAYQVGDETGRLRAGDVLVAPGGETLRYYATGPWSMFWIHLWKREPWAYLNLQTVHVRRALYTPQILAALQAILMEAHDEGNPLVVAALSRQVDVLVAYLQRELSADAEPDRRRDLQLFGQLRACIGGSLNTTWSVARICREAGMSRSSLYRFLRRVAGGDPQRLVARMRMERADVLLSRSDMKLQEIAEQVGYESAFAFSRAFKRHTGRSPTAYRKACKRS